jgi:hypothetical protein
MKKKQSTKSKSVRSVRNLPAKAVRQKTADGVKGGFEALDYARRLQAAAGKDGSSDATVKAGWN